MIQDPRELAVYVAAASQQAPKEVSTVMTQATRVLLGKDQAWGGLLDESGIKEGQGFNERLQRLFARMEKAEKSGQKVTEFLINQGVYAEAALGIGVLYQQRGVIQSMLGPGGVGAQSTTGAQAIDTIQSRYKADAGLENAKRTAQLEATKRTAAEGRTSYANLLLKAENDLIARGELDSVGGGLREFGTGLLAGSRSPGETGRRIIIEREARRQLADRMGTTEGIPLGDYSGGMMDFFSHMGIAGTIRENWASSSASYADRMSKMVDESGILNDATGLAPTTAEQGDTMINLLRSIDEGLARAVVGPSSPGAPQNGSAPRRGSGIGVYINPPGGANR